MCAKTDSLTFAQISRLTSTEADAIAYAEQLRWPEGIICHRCGADAVARLRGRRGRYRCRRCLRQFSIRTGTPMECSRLPVATWLRALWLLLSSARGISSTRLAAMLGVTQKTAWFLAHRAREMMAFWQRGAVSGDVVEIDEVYADRGARGACGRADRGSRLRRGHGSPT